MVIDDRLAESIDLPAQILAGIHQIGGQRRAQEAYGGLQFGAPPVHVGLDDADLRPKGREVRFGRYFRAHLAQKLKGEARRLFGYWPILAASPCGVRGVS
jgi:hypothetical protein